MKLRENETQGYLFGLLGVLAFSFTLPFTRIATRELDPTFVGLGRALLAALLSALLLAVTRQPVPTRQQFYGLALVALGVVIGFPLASAWAMHFVPSSHGAIVNALLPLGTAIGGAVLNRSRPSPVFWFAAVTGSVVVLAFVLMSSGTASIASGDALMLIAVALGCLGYVAGGKMSVLIGSWQTICWANIIAFPLIIYPVVSSAVASGIQASISAWLAFVYLGVISMFLGFFAWYRGLALGGTTRVSQVQLIQAFLTVLWSALLLGETVSPLMVGAAILVVAMIFVARRAPISQAANVYTQTQPNP